MTDPDAITRATRAMCRELYGEEFDLHDEGSLEPDFRASLERAAEAAIDTVIDQGVADGIGLKSFNVENGTANLSFDTKGIAQETVLVMLDGLADMLGDAVNYVEFDLKRRGKIPVSVCVRRYAHPTPHDLRVKAEKERDELAAEVERLRAGINAITVHSRLQAIGTTQRGDVIEGRKWADILAVTEPLAAVDGNHP